MDDITLSDTKILRTRSVLSISGFLILAIICGCASGGGGESSGSSSSSSGSSSSGSSSGSLDRIGHCGTAETDNDSLASLASLYRQFQSSFASRSSLQSDVKADSVVEIPVYFHLISRGDAVTDGEIPDSWCLAQIDVLNRVYSGGDGGLNTPYRFRLAGINRVRNPDWSTVQPGTQAEVDMKDALHRGGAETLNVYSTNIEDGILGYSSLPFLLTLIPSMDGIVLNYQTFPGGPLNRYNTGYVLVHETGHWLGLFHTFQGGCDGFLDDLVEDTPRELQPGAGEFCPVGRDSCPNQPGIDPIHNHMTYTEDSCRTEFTEGQLQFIRFNSIIFRGFSV